MVIYVSLERAEAARQQDGMLAGYPSAGQVLFQSSIMIHQGAVIGWASRIAGSLSSVDLD